MVNNVCPRPDFDADLKTAEFPPLMAKVMLLSQMGPHNERRILLMYWQDLEELAVKEIQLVECSDKSAERRTRELNDVFHLAIDFYA